MTFSVSDIARSTVPALSPRYFPVLRHLFTAYEKMPKFAWTVWRGVKGDLSGLAQLLECLLPRGWFSSLRWTILAKFGNKHVSHVQSQAVTPLNFLGALLHLGANPPLRRWIPLNIPPLEGSPLLAKCRRLGLRLSPWVARTALGPYSSVRYPGESLWILLWHPGEAHRELRPGLP